MQYALTDKHESVFIAQFNSIEIKANNREKKTHTLYSQMHNNYNFNRQMQRF